MAIPAGRSFEIILDAEAYAAEGVAVEPDVWVVLCARRRISFFVRGSFVTIPEGTMALFSSEHFGEQSFEAFSGVMLLVRGAAVSPRGRKLLVSTANRRGFQNVWSRMLSAYLSGVDEALLRVARNNESDWMLIQHQVIALLRRALREESKGTSPPWLGAAGVVSGKPDGERLFGEICAWVTMNLANPEMSLGFVASHFQLSSRSIQNLFSRYGEKLTFVSYLRQQRLLRAKAMLLDAAFAQQTIAEIGWSCGFADPVYFSKVFRSFFGHAPGEMRREHALDEVEAK